MIVCNAIMLGSFLEGMEESGSVAGTALATASNFATSAAYGFFLWEEDLSMEWMVGFGMVVVGVLILSTATASKPTQADASKME
jgi:multidrug transporter EmrE-like cation transporter